MGKRKTVDEPPLADYWKPPADNGLIGGVGEPVFCLATTFEFDAGFFEAELLPRFLCLRFDHTENERTFIIEREESLATTHVGVLVDASKFDPRQTTLQWDQLPIQVPGGIQHAKLTVLVWERIARLIVGSANLTRQGYRRNRELFAALDFFDAPDSAPLSVLRDALAFIDTLCTWSRALPAATQRIHETIDQIQARVRPWSSAPQNFSPRERPRAGLVVSHPAHALGSAQSSLKQLIRIWMPRRAVRLTVMTPFVGQQTNGEDTVLHSMRELPMARNVEGRLIVPEVPAPEGEKGRIVPLPQAFGRCWKKRFGKNARVLLVPMRVDGADERPRDLHAKAILIEGDSYDVLMIGSSNFTPHGMGIGAFNCEANLVFEDKADEKRNGRTFGDRLGVPVSWDDALDVDDIVWQAPEQAPEDDPSAKPHLPAFFTCASYSQTRGELRVGIDRTQPEPVDWNIRLPGQSAEPSVSLFTRTSCSSNGTTLFLTLDERTRGIHLTALRVSWTDEDAARQEAFLAVAVENKDTDLLPPEEFRRLSVDGIIECLLSGRSPAEWIEKRGAWRKRYASTDAAIESLRAVDTSNYVLYRVRRFGRALAAMADRIVRTSPTPNAIRYRLLRDPLGPVHLADALFDSGNGHEDGHPWQTETGYQLYVLAEMLLSIGHIAEQVGRSCGRDGKWVMPLFHEARERILSVIQRIYEQSASLPEDLSRYLEACLSENVRLLNVAQEE
ncbi:MAG: hypothetical protein AB1547_10025 [Thermodesulfobacteriota bacterium]